MIKIVNVQKPDVSYTLLEGKTYAVGRKQGEIIFPDDQSISRNHGEIQVEHPAANVTNATLTPTVCIVDFGSKFGTFANEGIARRTSLAMREKLYLSPGDTFKFGLQWNEFRIDYTPLITTSSAVSNTLQLKQYMCKLGGHLVSEWTQKCDFVIMEAITLTVKAVCALLSGKRFVKPEYFSILIDRIEKGHELPNPADFLPILAEHALKSIPVSFEPKKSRATVFAGKMFMFTSLKHMKKVDVAIKCGGGNTCLIAAATDQELAAPNTVLIGLMGDDSCADELAFAAIEKYKQSGKRVVPESEIGLAALHCSSSKHCNPLYSFKKAIFPTPRMTTQTQSSSSSLASSTNASFKPVPETQDIPTQLSTNSHSESINVVEETMIGTASGRRNKTSSIEILDISNEDMEEAGPSNRFKNSKGRRDDDVDILPISKRRLQQTPPSDSLEPSIKRPRTQPITENKTLSSLFASSSDEDEETYMQGVSSLASLPMVTESVDPDVKHENEKEQINSERQSLPRNSSAAPTTSGTANFNWDTQEDLFPTDVSHSDHGVSNLSVKRKLEDEEIMQPPKGKSRKIDRGHESSSMEQKVADIGSGISGKLILKEEEKKPANGTEDKIEPCPTVFMKGLVIEKRPPPAPKGKQGKSVVNFKRFQKSTPLNTSFRANSIHDDSMAPIRLVICGEENRSFSAIPNVEIEEAPPNTKSVNQNDLFGPATTSKSVDIPNPESRPRRTTRSTSSSPNKPGPSGAVKPNPPAAKNKMNDSELDFERHVEGGTRATRSRAPVAAPTPPPTTRTRTTRQAKKPDVDDIWSF